jgi:NADH-quinone oxidoreductase subunit N
MPLPWPSPQDLFRIGPEIVLTIFGTLAMVLEPLTGDGKGEKPQLRMLTLVGLVLAGVAALLADPGTSFNNMIRVDGFSTFFRLLTVTVGLLTVLASSGYLVRERHENGEFYALLMFSIAGQSIMASANELIVLFIGLEISSIASYILAGFLRDDKRNNESAVKYFLLGSFATAFLLYGVAWIYGLAGSTNLDQIRAYLGGTGWNPTLVGMAAGLMFVGFAFKVSAAPFQAWAPDVYQGAPAPVSAFLSAGPKAAAFAMFLRVFLTAFGPIADRWEPLVWGSALLTMIIGNFAALRQTNVKRMLAYSSIAHAGYSLVAVATHSKNGTAAVMFYLAAYAFMNIGAFAVVSHLARRGEKHVEVNDLAGLGERQPVTAALLTVYMLSLIGIPLTAGFFGKFYIFKAAIEAGFIWLTVAGLLTSAVAAWYYLQVLVVIWMREPGEAVEAAEPLGPGLRVALLLSAAGTFFLGVFPGFVLDAASKSASLIK